MAYRLRVQMNVDWIGPGAGVMTGQVAVNEGLNPAGGAQTLAFFSQNEVPSFAYTTNTFTNTDVTNLLATVTTDFTAQLEAAESRIQGFASGGG